MNHQEIEQQDIIERYVLHKLSPAERRAFQEHYFACEECFEQVQTTARFIAGVRQAARQGVLTEAAAEKEAWWASLFRPALGLAVAAALVLIVVFGWLLFKFKQPSAPSQEIAHEQAPSPAPGQTASPEQSNSPQLANEKNERPKPPKLEDQRDLLAQNRPPAVLLESSRDSSASGNQLALPANASSAILRIEVEPGSSFASFQFQVFDSSRRLVTTVSSGKARPPRARGSVAVSVPASQLQTGKYLVKCYGMKDGQRQLVGEYDLHVRRQ